jgi:aspartate aminotransferase-like enzyme
MASLTAFGHRFARLCHAYAIDMQWRSVQIPASSRPEMVSKALDS